MLSALIPLSFFACGLPMPDEPLPVEQSESPPSASQVAEDLGYSTVVEEGEEYDVFAADESDYELNGWPDPPPKEPPSVVIVSKNEDRGAVVEGVPYYVQWLARDEAQQDLDVELNELLSEIMPPPVRLPPIRSLRIMTTSRTHLIMVAGFDDSSPADEAQTDFDESGFWECGRSDKNPCERISAEGFIEYHRIPPAVFRHRYMSVFAMWSNPPTIVGDKIVPPDGPDFVHANWFFHLADE